MFISARLQHAQRPATNKGWKLWARLVGLWIALDTMIVGVFWSKLGTTGVIFLRGRLFAQDGFGSNAACHGVWTLNVIQLSEVL
jgi:hypothetical protein